MRCVLVTGTNLEHAYVANVLARSIDLAAIVVETGVRRSPWHKLRRAFRRFGLAGTLNQLGSKALHVLLRDRSHRRRVLAEILADGPCDAIRRQDLVATVDSVNSDAALQLLASLAPDVLLVYGTGIVGRRALGIARVVSLNLHTGISPHYRGATCHLWALHDGRPDMVGATIHECVADVDGGRVFATARAELQEHDGLHAAFARSVQAGAQLYARVVRDVMAGTAVGVPQDLGIGREWRVADCTVAAELRARRAIRRGLIRQHVGRRGARDPDVAGPGHERRC